MHRPLKPFKTFDEQIGIIRERGMIVEDIDSHIKVLHQMNYYRFSGYAYQFLTSNNKYRRCSFNDIVRLYRFDQEFRSLLFSFLEDIEIYARTQIAYNFTHIYGPDGYYYAKNFYNADYHAEFLKTLSRQIEKNKSSTFVAHHISNYGGRMPLWCAVEVLSFSTLSMFFSNLKWEDAIIISRSMGIMDVDMMKNWLHCFSVLRNTCAHYGRIYNNSLSLSISLGGKTLRRNPSVSANTIFAYIVAMLRFCPNAEKKARFKNNIASLVEENKDVIDLRLLGFPDNWKTLLFDPTILL